MTKVKIERNFNNSYSLSNLFWMTLKVLGQVFIVVGIFALCLKIVIALFSSHFFAFRFWNFGSFKQVSSEFDGRLSESATFQ